jgi:hypothetical protein
MRLLNTGVDHFLKHICVLSEVDKQLLFLLHVAVGIGVYLVSVVEKQIVL